VAGQAARSAEQLEEQVRQFGATAMREPLRFADWQT